MTSFSLFGADIDMLCKKDIDLWKKILAAASIDTFEKKKASNEIRRSKERDEYKKLQVLAGLDSYKFSTPPSKEDDVFSRGAAAAHAGAAVRADTISTR